MIRGYVFSGIAIVSFVAGIALRDTSPVASIVFLITAATATLAHVALRLKSGPNKLGVKTILGPGQKLGRILIYVGLATIVVPGILQLLGLSNLVAGLIGSIGLIIFILGIFSTIIGSMSSEDK